VPDNQEVFAHSKSDQSFIFDILEYAADVADEAAAEYHFRDLVGEGQPGTVKKTHRMEVNLLKYFLVYFLVYI
jgi:hypothetical protein